MSDDVLHELEEWKEQLEFAWRQIPKAFRNDHAVRRTLQCHLFGWLCLQGHRVVADYMPPRVLDRGIDLIVLRSDHEILHAICIEPLVSLAAVKSLSSFASDNKIIFTTGALEKKVQESRFFLKPDIQHLHLQPFGQRF